MDPISILTTIVQAVPEVLNKIEETKVLQSELRGLSVLVSSVAEIVLHHTKDAQFSGNSEVINAYHFFAQSLESCLHLVKKILAKNPVKRFLKSGSYSAQVDDAISKLSFKLLLLNTAVCLVQLAPSKPAAEVKAEPADEEKTAAGVKVEPADEEKTAAASAANAVDTAEPATQAVDEEKAAEPMQSASEETKAD
ncbi:hypothetical protein PLESTB_000587800 [Pleodorina starrii]|uniref:Uncharacterized protein n=1 Tax=Pleodorina starrii TaxID=330485 RepID=A0A9W6BHY6_9CHLO|nr:hypothetical protein PLESTM_000297000 [Pleodorina starrii]GLC52145.1 hypothetical protein PLESTB_000587800 [Pleodorina starrii]GLC72285.1 hypothetical protein PLESTF_001227700 [Pleodorina starrii]